MQMCTGVQFHGVYMGPKVDCDKLMQASGLLKVPSIQYSYYNESNWLTAAIQITKLTSGTSRGGKAPRVRLEAKTHNVLLSSAHVLEQGLPMQPVCHFSVCV